MDHHEIARRAMEVARGVMCADDACEGTTEEDRRTLFFLVAYELDRIASRYQQGQRRAKALLLGFLDEAQLADLRRRGSFLVTGSVGGLYRLAPKWGSTQAVERHGSKTYVRRWFCLHDERDGYSMPPADLCFAHMLLLMADEPAFLAQANATRSDMWDGDYVRRMGAARRARAAA